QELGGKQMSSWRFTESPLVEADQVVASPGGSKGCVAAFNKQNGELLWQSKEFTDAAGYASLIAVDIGGVHQYIRFTGASVAGIAAKDGKLLWRVDRPGRTAVIPTP